MWDWWTRTLTQQKSKITAQIEAAKEVASRQSEALRLFRPMATQEEILCCYAKETLVRGGNRCQAASTVVWRKDGSPTTLGEVQVGDEIMAWKDDRSIPSRVLYKTEFAEKIVEVRFTDGGGTSGTVEHMILMEDGEWQELRNTLPGDRCVSVDGVKTIESVRVGVWCDRIVSITTEAGSYISDDVISHNSGKSMISAVRFASIATDIPVTTKNGDRIYCRLPHQRGRPLTMWCIGYGETHIGQTLYRLLFQRGAFKIIRDEKTHLWRAYDPTDPRDLARASEVKESPPLIPNRYIDPKGWVWKNKGARVFEKAVIVDPTTKEVLANIYAFTSSGEVKAGDPVDEIWVDEKIEYPAYYPEWVARLIDKSGRLWWSSWPDISNNALIEMHKRAIEHIHEEAPPIKEFVLKMGDNVHLPPDAKKDAIRAWSPDERRARDQGEFVTDSLRMYPRFDTRVHTAMPSEMVDKTDEVIRLLKESGGQPPNNWTREIIVDPGSTHPAALFVAITPLELGDYCIPYDEVYVPNIDADQLAKLVSQRAGGHHFYRFIMDGNAGRQTPMGFGRTVMQKYAESFAKHGLVSEVTGSSFIPGSNNVSGRIGELQDWMVVRNTGYPKLRIVTPFCKHLCEQLTYYLKDNANGVNEFKPAKRQRIDLATCLEYWAASSPRWVAPPRGGKPKSPAERMKALVDRMFNKKPADKSITLGPVS